MVKLTSYGIDKCKAPLKFTTLRDLCKVTGKQTLEELIALDFTPYITHKDLKKLSKEDICYHKNLQSMLITNKNSRISAVVACNNFYLIICNNTICINYAVCN